MVERPVVPEVFFRAANAWVAAADGEAHAIIPFYSGTGIVSGGPAATHFIKAPALARAVIVPCFHKLAGIEERATVALVVDALAVEHPGAAVAIELGQLIESENVGEDAGHNFRDGRAARHIDNGFVGNDPLDGFRTRGIGVGILNASVRSAGSPGHDGVIVFGSLFQDIKEAAPTDRTVDASILGGGIAFHREDVAALVVLHDLLANLFALLAGRGLQRLVVIEREHVEENILGDGMRAADKA